MSKLFIGIIAAGLGFAPSWALADDTTLINEMTMKPLTAAQSAQLRSERDAAKAKWATMTPTEKAAVTQSARAKKLGEMTALERYGANDDLMAMTKAQTAQAQTEHDAAKAKWEAMTPEQKTAARKALQQKRLNEMNEMERFGANNDMSRWASY